MFYFSGIVNGKYLKNEVKQLTLFISRVKVCHLRPPRLFSGNIEVLRNLKLPGQGLSKSSDWCWWIQSVAEDKRENPMPF